MVIDANSVARADGRSDKPAAEHVKTLRALIDGFAPHDAKPALISFGRNVIATITFQSMVDEIKSLAKGLKAQGVKTGDCIAFFAPNSPSWIISALAVIYSGATVVPIDSQQSDDILQHIIADSMAGWIFTDEKGSKRLKKILPKSGNHRVVRLDKEDIDDSWRKVSESDHKPAPKTSNSDSARKQIAPTDIAVLFYTSGTTGMPKGVPLNHTNILLQLFSLSKMDLLKPFDRVLLPLPLFHVYPLNIGLLLPLMLGLPIIMPRSLTGPEIMRALNEGRATVILGVPRLLRSLYQAISTQFHKNKIAGAAFEAVLYSCQTMDRLFGLLPGRVIFSPVRKKFCPSLRLFTCGGALLEADLSSKLRAIGWDVALGYGLTETSPLISMRLPDSRDLESVGDPIPGVEVMIGPLDEPDEQIPKNAGEILARGANVFGGYRNRPELAEKVFTAEGWFRTGDLGFFSNGHLRVIGRSSSTIVMEGGEKIQPENIEDKIAKQPGIGEIGLLQIDHKLVALIVPDMKEVGNKDVKAGVSSAVKGASAGLASYLQITDFAITNDPLPRTNLGKIKRHELKDRYEKAQAGEKTGKKGKSTSKGGDLNSADQTLMEEPAAEACLQWLKKKFPDHEITLDTSPQLDLNIDSLEWMNLTLELVEQTGVELSAESISKVATVRDLLNQIVNSADEGSDAISPLEDPSHYLNEKQREYLKPLSEEQSRKAHKLYNFLLYLMRPFKVTAVGLENLSADQVVFVPNHASYIDAFALGTALSWDRFRHTQWAGWTGIAFGNPVFSYLSRLARVFPIEAKQSLFASLALGVSVLKAGNNLVWFPEGERTLDGHLLPFKQGIGLILQRRDITVVPVYLDGTREALPPGAFFPRFHPINVIFGEPVKPSTLAKEGKGAEIPERIANALHDRVEALSRSYPQ